jgi:hypothetical protein
MQVYMKHCLACVGVRVEDRPVAVCRQSPLRGDCSGPPHELADNRIVSVAEIVQRGNVALGG